jgi:outer membrane protein assembly factor BamB
MSRPLSPSLLSLCLAGILAQPGPAQDWTRFRGPNGSGLSAASVDWSANNPLWKVKLPGRGHSSPVLWGPRLFVTSGDPQTGQRLIVCLSADDGRTLWTRGFPVAKHRQHEHNSWASGTPTVDDRHVYVPWASPKDYLVAAFDHSGQEKWRVDLGPYQSGHGFGSSLLVHEGLVIIPNEQEGKSALVALDRDTGKTRWQIPRRSKTTYSTPCLFHPKAGPAELIFASYEHGVTSIDPKTGVLNWEIDVFDKGHIETSIASPLVAGGMVLACSGWLGVKKEVIAIRPPRSGGKPEVAYKLTRGSPLVPTPLVKDNLLFLWDDDGVVTCADLQTGKTHWRERVEGGYYASPVCAGNRLMNVSRDGDLVTLAASLQFEMLERFSLGEGSHSTPAIAGNILYVRTFHHVVALAGKHVSRRSP